MSRDVHHNATPIHDKAALVEYFEAGCKARDQRGVGTEHEKFGVWSDSLEPVTYAGDRGIGSVLERVSRLPGFEVELDQGNILALADDRGAALTLEPGGQLELSGRITTDIRETAEELAHHVEILRPISQDLGIRWLGAGCHPLADVADIPWMPKSRYGLMRSFLGARGRLAHTMMKATSTIQANFDYCSESDAREVIRLGAALAPLVSAAFANSPILGGRDTGYSSYRCHVWTEVDPQRTGSPEFFLDGTFTFERYADYLLGLEVMFHRQNGVYEDAGAVTFAELMAGGIHGEAVTIGDWELHISTVFPDVRMKSYVEVRTADGGDLEAILALPALWKGVLYDDQARTAASALIGPIDRTQQIALLADVARHGLQATWRGEPLLPFVQRLVEIARSGLGSEAHFLAPLADRLSLGQNGASQMRAIAQSAADPRAALVEHLSLF